MTPSLLFVQATLDPMDDPSDGFDATLGRIREVLAPVLMDTSAITD